MINKLKVRLGSIIGFGISAIILIIIISLIFILSGGIMKLFGFQYNSVGNVILFFSVVAIIGFPTELLALAFPKALLALNKINMKSAKILFVMLDTISTMFIMSLVDYFMDSVVASDMAIFVISFIIAITSIRDLEKCNENRNKQSNY